MLNRVPEGMRRANRTVVTRHPNRVECTVWRRVVARTAGAESGNAAGRPTLGGLTVMDPEDEAQIELQPLGDAWVLFVSQYERQTMNAARDAPETVPAGEAMIEPVAEPVDGVPAFDIKDGDLVMVMPGDGVVIPYEVTNVLNLVNIPPFVTKYELSAQGDLMFLPDVAQSQEDRE
jgi:hypothetical protein